MHLLIDVGNTRLKWALYDNGQRLKYAAFVHHKQALTETLSEIWHDSPVPHRVALCCVSGEEHAAQIELFVKQHWPFARFVRARTEKIKHGVQIAYAQAEKLGVDRWLAMLAVHRNYHEPVCIVSCGTAITVDIMKTSGVHQGGVICAGFALMQQALINAASDLSAFNQSADVQLADNTQDAIANGSLLAVIGLIEQLMQKQDAQTRLIITGGDAEQIAAHLSYVAVVEPELVLQGLQVLLGTE